MNRVLKRLQQGLRAMVGVGDYEQYCEHMHRHHPQLPKMTHVEYFRHCQQARYPSRDAAIKRCPC